MFGGIGKSEGRLESKAKIRDSVQNKALSHVLNLQVAPFSLSIMVKMALLSQIVMYTVNNIGYMFCLKNSKIKAEMQDI